MHIFFSDSPEYLQRLRKPYNVPKASIADVRNAVPKHLYQKSTWTGLAYVGRDISFTLLAYTLGTHIDHFTGQYESGILTRYFLWVVYWFWQGIFFAGMWCLGHEAGHGTISNYGLINHVVGFTLHSFLLAPYYNWRATHHAHHKATGSVERDENYVPRTRTHYKLPPATIAHVSDYHDIFEEAPIYTLGRMLFMQLLGWQYYLFTNVMGSPMYDGKPNVNHFSPTSPLFKRKDYLGVLISDAALVFMIFLLSYYAAVCNVGNFVKLYLIPYFLANHWIVMLTYLHHSSPDIPHFRGDEWTFLRGAVSTVDRPLLGWIGRFFFHNVSHDHVAHHLFSSIPFYNQPEVTKHIKRVLKDDYNYDSTNSFRALYRSFTQCCFIEDTGGIVFYKDKNGHAQRQMANRSS